MNYVQYITFPDIQLNLKTLIITENNSQLLSFLGSFFSEGVGNILYFKAIWIILTTFKLQLGTSVQIAFSDETKLKVRGSVSLEKLMRSRTLILRKTNASLIFPSKYGQYLWRKKTIFAENFKKSGRAAPVPERRSQRALLASPDTATLGCHSPRHRSGSWNAASLPG